MTRPKRFTYQPGDYIFLNIPAIAKYEWHPFTISSSPEQQEQIWVHVRSVGTWTNKLYKYFEEQNQSLERDNELVEEKLPQVQSEGQSHVLAEDNDQDSIPDSDSSEMNNNQLAPTTSNEEER